ncbi:MAG TPA: hypothetical protein PKC28_16330 [Bdellovibrionales bacterium]|nr:hypothetical protein [Bdellovibrionales bacterium]
MMDEHEGRKVETINKIAKILRPKMSSSVNNLAFEAGFMQERFSNSKSAYGCGTMAMIVILFFPGP